MASLMFIWPWSLSFRTSIFQEFSIPMKWPWTKNNGTMHEPTETVKVTDNAIMVGETTQAVMVGETTQAVMVGETTQAVMVGETTQAVMVGETTQAVMVADKAVMVGNPLQTVVVADKGVMVGNPSQKLEEQLNEVCHFGTALAM